MKNKFIKDVTRRTLLKSTIIMGISAASANILPDFVTAAENGPPIEHPLQNPKKYTAKGNCPNCGMMLNMWARTRHEFRNSEGDHATCSIRCLADMSQNSGESPADVKVALYLQPETMIDGASAYYVVGSSANGTMTMKSKPAFATEQEAKDFALQYGGTIMDFNSALGLAAEELAASRPSIEKKRRKKGKIAEPTAETLCSVCAMYPARYPKNRCQVTTKGGQKHHFCSTQCLINFMADPKQYVKDAKAVTTVWVTVPEETSYEYAMGLYYLVGSNIHGPMGKEAIPYRSKTTAVKDAEKHGGRILRFKDISPQLVMESF